LSDEYPVPKSSSENADAEILELLHRGLRPVVVFKQQPFGDFELQALCRKPRLGESRYDLQGKAAVAELHRREIDGDLDAFRPFCGFEAGAQQCPFTESNDEPGFLRDGNEDGWRHHSAAGVFPAQQCFARRHAASA
jgi:hypothetical protein